jgi:uncharacterized protein DUF4304
MKAHDLIARLVAVGITPLLRPAGFRKAGFSFHRHLGEVVQVLNVQLSDSNLGERGRFYINVGLNFDRVCLLEGKPINSKPKEYECQLRRRLEQLIHNIHARWEFESEAQSDLLAEPLHSACEQLLVLLNQIDSIEHFLPLNWLQSGSDLGLRAQLHYILGDQAAAIQALQQEQAFFRTRPTWKLDYWLEQRGLSALRARLIEEPSKDSHT